ncbi:hypothetical protein [Bacillus sp. NEB1478]|uniref:hypothetical protein n=1 Tax=Bacillus sp. NEB1478 TaxID=3073816 RepID=UPI002872C7FC|nr:hypothetical protein [Bacillus sp. NEB1478]WNB91056.1 hypothetical protein RGB74_14225 [Bacillus sp. NEB1478]
MFKRAISYKILIPYIGQYISTYITGYGQVVANVVKSDKYNGATLAIYTPSGVTTTLVSFNDIPYYGPIPPVFGSGMGSQSGQGFPPGSGWGSPGSWGKWGSGTGF